MKHDLKSFFTTKCTEISWLAQDSPFFTAIWGRLTPILHFKRVFSSLTLQKIVTDFLLFCFWFDLFFVLFFKFWSSCVSFPFLTWMQASNLALERLCTVYIYIDTHTHKGCSKLWVEHYYQLSMEILHINSVWLCQFGVQISHAFTPLR